MGACHWRGRYNYAEHLIGVMYLSAHVLLALAVLYVAVPLIPVRMFIPYAITAITAAVAYFLWGYSQLFPGRTFPALFAGVAALLLGALSWAATLVWLLNRLRR